MSDHRVFLVGESNPYGSDPRFALYPQPPNAAGGRLARVLGMTDDEFLTAFERRNLLQGSWVKKIKGGWSAPMARGSADDLLRETEHSDRLVLLGGRVSAAFGVNFRENLCLERWVQVGTEVLRGRWVLVVPHPSGRSREWNNPQMRMRVRAAVEQIRSPKPADDLEMRAKVRAVAGELGASNGRITTDQVAAQIAAGARLSPGDASEVERFAAWMGLQARFRAGEVEPDEMARLERDLYPEGLGR